jgi:hypothetical protein
VDAREKGNVGDGYAFSYGAATQSVTAATGRGEVDRHAECTHHLQLIYFCPLRNGVQTKPGGEQISEPNRSQQTNKDFDTQALTSAFILKPLG